GRRPRSAGSRPGRPRTRASNTRRAAAVAPRPRVTWTRGSGRGRSAPNAYATWHLLRGPSVPCPHDRARGPPPAAPRPRGRGRSRRAAARALGPGAASGSHAPAARQPLHERAAGFMLSTTLIAWLPWTLASTMPFLPLLAGLVDRLRARGDRRLVALLALAVALDLVAGYPQAALQALAAIVAWAVARAPWR